MKPLDEMRSWLGLTKTDSENLRRMLPIVQDHIPRIIDLFYEEVQRHPGSNAVLTGPEQVERLKKTLRQWLLEVFEGPHDTAYVERRQAIGRRHVKVGLPDRYMFLAMHHIQYELTHVVRDALAVPQAHLDSLRKVLQFDLALMTGTYVEARELKQLDTLQSLLVQHLRVSVFLLDDRGVVTSATKVSARLAGIAQPTGVSWQQVLPPGLLENAHLDREMERAKKRNRQITLPRVDVEQADGSHRSFRIHLVPLAHELASMLVQIEELTDAVEMESRLRRSEALAQLGSLSAAVSHELRNPLAGISGALQVINRSLPEDAPHRPILEKVDAEVRRLNSLVTDLLAFARPGRVNIGQVDLHALSAETLELVAGDHPDVTYTLDGAGQAAADPDLVRQILHNLLRNAVDAAGENGSVRIDVSPGRLLVSDDGAGIPEEKASTIFEPFVTTKTRGTGLGLAISQRNAEAMHGTLRLAEGPLQGAAFELSLPIAPLDR